MNFVLGIWSGLSLKIKLAVTAAVIVALLAAGWSARGVWEKSKKVDELTNAINEQSKQQDKSHSVGMNLETGLNDYRPVAKELDRKVNNATATDTGNRFDANSVQRTSDRIAAGRAARERANAVR